MKTEKITEKTAISILNSARPRKGSYERLQKAFDMAIKALEKQIPKKPVIKPWSAATCPTCGAELSEDLGDGYYKHYTHWEYCRNPECLQKLDWNE